MLWAYHLELWCGTTKAAGGGNCALDHHDATGITTIQTNGCYVVTITIFRVGLCGGQRNAGRGHHKSGGTKVQGHSGFSIDGTIKITGDHTAGWLIDGTTDTSLIDREGIPVVGFTDFWRLSSFLLVS